MHYNDLMGFSGPLEVQLGENPDVYICDMYLYITFMDICTATN